MKMLVDFVNSSRTSSRNYNLRKIGLPHSQQLPERTGHLNLTSLKLLWELFLKTFINTYFAKFHCFILLVLLWHCVLSICIKRILDWIWLDRINSSVYSSCSIDWYM